MPVVASVVVILVPALLAFAAAIAGSLLAYRQWKGQRTMERGKGFDQDRAAAYRELWSRLEAVHSRLRSVEVRDDEFDASLRDLNSFILASEIYFEPGLRARVRAYLEAVRNVATIIKSYPPELQRDYGLTDDPVIDASEMKRLADAMAAADESRTVILDEVRANVGGA